MNDHTKVMQERSCVFKTTEYIDHNAVLTSILRSDEEHVRALTKNAVYNMASSFEPNAHPDKIR